MQNKKNTENQKKTKQLHSSSQFMTLETAYRQATKCPCPYQWKSNIPKYPGV
jgi:serine/threonine-protein kinase RIO1